MKNKYLYIKILGIASLIFLCFAYFVFYFMPTLKKINHRKRELKDMNYKIENFIETENEFDFSTDLERMLFKAADEELVRRVSSIKSREDFMTLFTQIFDYIKNQASKDGIFNLMITSNSNELELNASTLSTDKKSLSNLLDFASTRLSELKKEEIRKAMNPNPLDLTGPLPGPPAPLIPGLTYQTVYLSFSGELMSALNFINHIPWSEHYLRVGEITVSNGDAVPFFMVFLKVYFLDEREVAKK
ncbi:MAG: hypothetical protein GY757_34025 [bacterium]|nr:hypothetical protein [bacterium]